MKRFWIHLAAAPTLAAALSLAPSAWAGNVAHCEALIMQIVASEAGEGEAQIASFHPAVNFLSSLYDDEEGHLADIDGQPIRAIMCRRNDIIPTDDDYPILATGLAFVLSQDFDSAETDSLTLYWKDGIIEQVYKGKPLSEDAQAVLDTRLAQFSERGINAPTREAPENAAAAETDASEFEDVAVIESDAILEIETAGTDIQTEIENQE